MTATVDLNSPFIQQMMRTNPNLLQQLGLTPAPGSPAQLAVPGAQVMTADVVRQIVDERLAAATKTPPVVERLAGVSAQFEQVFQKALPAEDYAAFQKYVADGSPGFADMLAGDKLHPIAQLLWETIKEGRP